MKFGEESKHRKKSSRFQRQETGKFSVLEESQLPVSQGVHFSEQVSKQDFTSVFLDEKEQKGQEDIHFHHSLWRFEEQERR